jgi:SAM-dependent methyltransferase
VEKEIAAVATNHRPTDAERTIRDFGRQWTTYKDNTGYYGSADFFADIWGPLRSEMTLEGSRVADIGAGTGRFVNVFLDAGVNHVVAIEPSDAMNVLKANTANRQDRITYLQTAGDQIPEHSALDYVFAIGVLHHIPDPLPVLRAARAALKPGGCCFAWLYGSEGNGVYISLVSAVRALSRRAPHRVIVTIVWLLYGPLRLYMTAARVLPLPLRHYMTQVLAKLNGTKIRLVMYDQLNPAHAKFYSREQVIGLFTRAGYQHVRLYHRHGYSWAVKAVNPAASPVTASSGRTDFEDVTRDDYCRSTSERNSAAVSDHNVGRTRSRESVAAFEPGDRIDN